MCHLALAKAMDILSDKVEVNRLQTLLLIFINYTLVFWARQLEILKNMFLFLLHSCFLFMFEWAVKLLDQILHPQIGPKLLSNKREIKFGHR